MVVISTEGKPHRVIRWVSSEHEPDLCVILSEGRWGSVVPVAAEDPVWGDRIWSIAAPHGIFIPGAPLLFEGTWSGQNAQGDVIVTMPCAPGSSGSALVNGRGEIVGVVHSTSLKFQEIAIATNRTDVIKFIGQARWQIMGIMPPADLEIDPEVGKLPL
jgi:hypothetical protein